MNSMAKKIGVITANQNAQILKMLKKWNVPARRVNFFIANEQRNFGAYLILADDYPRLPTVEYRQKI